MLRAMVGGTRRDSGRRRILRNLAVAVLVAVSATLVVGVVISSRNEATLARRSARGYTPPSLTPPSPAALPVVAVIGDDTTSSAAPGIGAVERWTALLEREADVDVKTYASAGAGYVSRGSDGRTFLNQASRIPANASVVVIFGGIGDLNATELAVSRAASQTISAVQTRAPKARLAVVAPVTDRGGLTEDVTALRTTLKNAAGAFDMTVTDPIQQAWLNGSPDDGSDLTAADQRTLAQRFDTVVSRLLPTSG